MNFDFVKTETGKVMLACCTIALALYMAKWPAESWPYGMSQGVFLVGLFWIGRELGVSGVTIPGAVGALFQGVAGGPANGVAEATATRVAVTAVRNTETESKSGT